jgi:Na+-transporting methylmalonyl-CoA/oxaloacetate decarboxylase gamma subunit
MPEYNWYKKQRSARNMEIDWGEAGRIGGMGFGFVFALLAFLSVLIWLSGWINNKIGTGKSDADDKKRKGA